MSSEMSREDLLRYECLDQRETARGLSADLLRIVLAEHELLTGEVNLAEFRRTLRGRFKVPASEVSRPVRELREHTIVHKPRDLLPLKVRDPDDAFVLASAAGGGADVLVTGDEDLLEVADAAPLPILTPRGCWLLLQGRSPKGPA